METLRDLNQKDGLTVLVTLHQVDYALSFCPRTIALKHGRIVYDGPSAELTPAFLKRLYGTECDPLFVRPESDIRRNPPRRRFKRPKPQQQGFAMFSRFLIAVAAAAVVLGGSVCAKAAEVLNFGIISTESSQNLKQFVRIPSSPTWKRPPASEAQGVLRFGLRRDRSRGCASKRLDLCWIGNKGAIQMVDRSDGSVFAQTTAADGTDGYYSLLVVNKESPLKSVDDVLKNAAELRFSNGDPNSTSGFLVPGYYVFAKNNADPKKIFKNVVAANHESNALAVANRQVDVATCNNEAISRLEIAHPEKAAQIREIWRSPLIPSDPLVWRNSLPESTKKKIADFIFGYGVKGDVAHAKAILEKLQWGPFKPSTNAQLVPLRQLELFREKSKLEANAEMPAAEKAERIKKIDEALDRLSL